MGDASNGISPAARSARAAWSRYRRQVPIERREFLLLASAAVTGAGLAGCTGASPHPAGEPAGGGPASSAPAPATVPATASPSARTQPAAPLGPQVVHGSRDRPQVALTFHGQGPAPMAEALLAEA